MRRDLARVVLVILAFAFAAWQLNHLGGLRWDWDEGVYLSSARLANQGWSLYGDVAGTASPLFINSIQAGFRLAGETIAAGRGAIVLCAALGLLAIGMIAWDLSGPVAGIAAVIALALAPHFYVLSRVVIGDVPSMALTAVAVWAGLRFGRGGKPGWLFLAGFFLSLGALMKMTALLAVPVIAYYGLVSGRSSTRRMAMGAVMGIVGFVLPIALYVPFLDWRACVDQTVLLIWNQTATFVPDRGANAETVGRYLILDNRNIAINRGLTILGLLGLAVAFRRKPALVAGVWLWLALILFAVLSYAPLWPHLLSPLLFPLALGFGLGLAELRTAAVHLARRRSWADAALASVLLIGALTYAVDVPRIVREDAKRAAAPDGDTEREAIEWLRQHTGPSDRVVTDEPVLAFEAGRSVPPGLADASIMRIAVGSVTSEQVIQATRDPRTAAVVLWKDNRFVTYLADYVRWLEAEWQPARQFDPNRRIFVRKDASIQ